ncbi:MAG: sugar phosphate isomerase/epimerase [Planctomycetes bacterium]|nr:sugar phosphate isomerase/epimerase [Planctomycetota bacterium]
MKVGIDSYCYHRFFGEVYAQQRPPAKRMTLEDFIDRARALGVDGVSLESCFIPRKDDPGYLAGIRDRLDAYGFDRVYAWGHPDGLQGGRSRQEYDDLVRSLDHAQSIGATVMRIVGSSLVFRFEDHQEQIARLVVQLREAVRAAADHGIRLAIENHIDFTATEILQLIDEVGSLHLGVNFDTGNFARLLDDPVKGMEFLAKHTFATHIKDLRVNPAAAVDDWFFFSTTPVGRGFIDNVRIARLLKQAGYQGFLAMELDFLHPDFADDEDAAVAESVRALRAISDTIEAEARTASAAR